VRDWKKLLDDASEQVGQGVKIAGDGLRRGADEAGINVGTLAKADVGGALGDVLHVAQAVRSMTASPVRWKLRAHLDIAWKRNSSNTIDLSVRES